MAFDTHPAAPRRIAVIGGGVSGLHAARLLAPAHQVTLFEAAPRLGGHAHTVLAGRNEGRAVDTGFIVFNPANHPHLGRLFDDLDVPVEKSDMSFGASVEDGRIEDALRSPGALLAQPRNALRPAFLGMIRDILRFNARAPQAATDDMTLADLVAHLRLGRWFEHHYLRPMCAAIWSTPAVRIGDFPARAMVRFFLNHGLMSARGQHQWWTVRGGSIAYVERLAADLKRRGVALRTRAPVATVRREGRGVALGLPGGAPERFDEVVLACHADVALRLLADATRSSIALHSPRRRASRQCKARATPGSPARAGRPQPAAPGGDGADRARDRLAAALAAAPGRFGLLAVRDADHGGPPGKARVRPGRARCRAVAASGLTGWGF